MTGPVINVNVKFVWMVVKLLIMTATDRCRPARLMSDSRDVIVLNTPLTLHNNSNEHLPYYLPGMWPRSWRLGLEAVSRRSSASARSCLGWNFKRLGLALASRLNVLVLASVSGFKVSLCPRSRLKRLHAVHIPGILALRVIQESLADAKVSARQQCVYEDP